jgi:hypothetical protein
MYVLSDRESGQVFGFGSTPKRASLSFFRFGPVGYDGPALEIFRCSPALYRRLKVHDRISIIPFFCRINAKGIAVCPKSMPGARYYQRY